MPLSLRNCLFGLLTAVAFTRCADLKEVGRFAVASQQVMDKNRSAAAGYASYSQDSIYLFHYLPDHLRDVDCHCDAARQADAGIAGEYALLSTYFGVLAKFADPKASISFAPIGAPLPAGDYGSVSITTQEAGFAAALAKGLTALATTQYKARRIPGFMATYRDSVAPLITLLKIRADNLAGKVGVLQLQLDRVADSLISFAAHKELKMPVLFVYEQKKKELEGEQTAYRQRAYELETVIAGGQLIVDNIDNLHSASFRDKMVSVVGAISLHVK
ncbi:MAG TPA: hypothetical protein VNW04_18630 [Puia sp.]|jgi:hypothetical protein|nr:hypothetical protein [Puia sp.]